MENSVRIKLKSDSSSILKTGFVFRAIFIGSIMVGAAALGISMLPDNWIVALCCFAISLGLIIVIYRMLGAAFQTEEVLVNKNALVIIQKGINTNTQESILLDDIQQMGFIETHFTPNAMDNKIIDFTGLGAQERELQYVIDEGNIAIETETQSIRFGKKLPSWEVEEFIEQVEEITGRKFKRLPLKEAAALTDLVIEDDGENEEKPE